MRVQLRHFMGIENAVGMRLLITLEYCFFILDKILSMVKLTAL